MPDVREAAANLAARGRVLILVLSVLLHVDAAQTAPIGPSQDVDRLEAITDEVALRKLLDEPPPTGLKRDLEDFFMRQSNAARRLGEFDRLLAIARQRAEAFPASEWAQFSLWRSLFRSDRLAESDELGIRMLQRAQGGTDASYVRIGARLARDYAISGRLVEAEGLLKQVEPRAHKLENLTATSQRQFDIFDARAKWDNAWCELDKAKGRYADGLAFCLDALDMFKRRFDLRAYLSDAQRANAAADRTDAYIDLSSFQIASGQLFDAENNLHEAIRTSAVVEGRSGRDIVGIYNGLAQVRIEQQRMVEARRYAQQALRFATVGERGKLGNETRNSYAVLFRILVIQHAWTEASGEFDKVDLLSEGNAELRSRVRYPLIRALTYAETGKSAQAVEVIERYLTELRPVFGENHIQTALARGVRGMALARGADPSARLGARSELTAAIQVLTNSGSSGRELLELGERPTIRRLIFESYLQVIGDHPSPGEVSVAFVAADALRGSSVQNAMVLASVRGAVGAGALAEVVRSDQDANNELRSLYEYLDRRASDGQTSTADTIVSRSQARIRVLEELRTALEARLKREFPDYNALINPAPPTPVEVAALLSADELFVQIVPAENYTYVWAITQDGQTAFRRADLGERDRARLVGRLRQTLEVAESDESMAPFDFAAAHELYALLLGPLEDLLAGRKHLIIVTSGSMAQIPFSVLVRKPQEATARYASAPWLVRDFSISHVPSASAWASLKSAAKTAEAPDVLLAWGDPKFGADSAPVAGKVRSIHLDRASGAVDEGTDALRSAVAYGRMPQLPETRDELYAIASTLGANATEDLLLGDRATRDSVLAASLSGQLARKRVLVFATHGLIAGDLPNLDQPALALAATGHEDGDPLAPLLTLKDILTLHLNADWVVLSACNTAGADGQANEALSGLARGFFYAGARSLLVTHWAVETESAKLLTTRTFAYRQANPGASKAESLRQAMLGLMSTPRYGHPAYWAPYVLVGDGGEH